MTPTADLHPVQSGILRALLFVPSARFAELNTQKLSTDQFTFHIKRLQELQLLEKRDDGAYVLTVAGKEFANRMDTDTAKIERQPKVGVLVVPTRVRDGVREYLVQERRKQPYFGYHGFVTGKVRWGELLHEAAARELAEETGLTAALTYVGIKHKMDYDASGALLEDKVFFAFRADDCAGTLLEAYEGGRNAWMTEEAVMQLEHRFDGVEESIQLADAPVPYFLESKYTVSGY